MAVLEMDSNACEALPDKAPELSNAIKGELMVCETSVPVRGGEADFCSSFERADRDLLAKTDYLIAAMGLQVVWSFGLACLDIHALRLKKDLHNHILVSLFVVGAWP